jgi:hypothetical protein
MTDPPWTPVAPNTVMILVIVGDLRELGRLLTCSLLRVGVDDGSFGCCDEFNLGRKRGL